MSKIELYAASLPDDLSTEKFQQVIDSKLETFYMGTVYGYGVGTAAGVKFKTPDEAYENAHLFVEQCREIVGTSKAGETTV